jgi:Cu/Zn superoxide dismutase
MTRSLARGRLAVLSCLIVAALSGCGADDTAGQPADDGSEAAPARAATCDLEGQATGTASLEQTSDGLVMAFTQGLGKVMPVGVCGRVG